MQILIREYICKCRLLYMNKYQLFHIGKKRELLKINHIVSFGANIRSSLISGKHIMKLLVFVIPNNCNIKWTCAYFRKNLLSSALVKNLIK